MNHQLIEIRTYRLKPGTGGQFHQLVGGESVALHTRWGMDVVACGPSVGDADTYVLIRAYDDPASLESSQAAFYASAAWRDGPREAIVSRILSHAHALLWLPRDAIDRLRNARWGAA